MALNNYEIIDKLNQRDMGVYNNLSMLMDMCIAINDEPETLKLDVLISNAKKVKHISSVESRRDVRFMDLYWKALHILAPHDFDSYMIYMERERPARNRFYLPRRKQLVKIGAVKLLQDIEDDVLDVAGLSVPPGCGKAQPLYSKVLTPTGFVSMGSLREGSKIITSEGNVAEVFAIFPQGVKSIYEVTCKDGAKFRCSDEHLIPYSNGKNKVKRIDVLQNFLDLRYTKHSIHLLRRMPNAKKGFPVTAHKIKDIRYVGEEECQCIYISDPCHMYITDDYIITHNTTLGEFYITWIIGRHVNDYSIFASHSNGVCRMFYDAIDALTGSAEYKFAEVFPEVKRQSTNAKELQINFGTYKPFKSISCVSIGQNLAGRVRANRLLYSDDLVSGLDVAVSKPRLDKLWQEYTVDLLQRRIDGCKELCVATRWSTCDPQSHLMEKNKGNPRARFVAVPDLDPETGESNFNYKYGVGFSKEYFEDVANTMDEVSYRCLYKNDPIEREGLLYPEDSLRRYLTLPDREPDAVLGICDSKSKGKDYMFLPCFYQYGNDYYMEDCICSNESDFEIQYQRIADIIINHKMQMVDFESNSGGDRIASEIEKRIQGKQNCGITMHYTTQNKETKIIVNAEWVKKHCLFKDRSKYIPKSDYGVAMNFIMTYTVAGKNIFDDCPDGLAQFAQFTNNLLGSKTEIIESPF